MNDTQKPERWINDEFNHEFALTDDDVRSWAFDEDKVLLSQDEDLIIGTEEKLYPVFVDLAFDPDCPKADYIRQSIDYDIIHDVFGGGNNEAIRKIDDVVSLLPNCESATKWKQRLQQLKTISAREDSPIDEATAVDTAKFIWGAHFSHEDTRNFCVKHSDGTSILVWRGHMPSWGICFDRKTGRMSRMDVLK